MTLDLTKPVMLRCGLKARVYDTNLRHGAYEHLDGQWSMISWTHNWNGIGESGIDPDLDLINIPEEPKKYVFWVNMFLSDDGSMPINGDFYLNRHAADKRSSFDLEELKGMVLESRGRIACVRIQFCEGQFDE